MGDYILSFMKSFIKKLPWLALALVIGLVLVIVILKQVFPAITFQSVVTVIDGSLLPHSG